MKETPTLEQIGKLPKWAQGHIKILERERASAVRALNEFCDNQKPSPFYIEDWVCTGERQGPSTKRIYLQTRSISVKWAGVDLRLCVNDKGGMHRHGIGLQWQSSDGRHHVSMVPVSYQSIELVDVENL